MYLVGNSKVMEGDTNNWEIQKTGDNFLKNEKGTIKLRGKTLTASYLKDSDFFPSAVRSHLN